MSRRVGSRTRRQVGGSGGSVPAFTPASLGGLVLWTKSDTGVTVDTTVTGWADLSGQGNSFIPTGTGPLLNASDAAYGGKPSLNFNAATCALVTNKTVPYGVYTLFLAIQFDGGTVGYLSTHQDGHEYFYGTTNFSSYTERGGVASAFNVSPTWAVSASPRTVTRRFDGTHAGDILRINGSLTSVTSAIAGDPGTDALDEKFSVMGSLTGGGGSTGTIAEVIVYNVALTDGQVSQVEDYLRTRYGYY